MISSNKMQENLTIILLLGTLTATFLVLAGGSMYLWNHGQEILQLKLLETSHFKINIRHLDFSYSPLFIIVLGLLTLVATQILRVLLLVFYYGSIRDYKFTFISLFVLLVLIYSFIAQK